MCSCTSCLFASVCLSSGLFFFNDTATTEIYTLSLHDALPICAVRKAHERGMRWRTPIWNHRSEEHTSELQSRFGISYAVFCLKKKNKRYSGSCCVALPTLLTLITLG